MPKEQGHACAAWMELVENRTQTPIEVKNAVACLVSDYDINEGIFFEKLNYGSDLTPLMLASYYGRNDVVAALIKGQADVNYGFTLDINHNPLITAALRGHLSVAQILIESHANVNLVHCYGYSPMMAAASSGNLELIKYLYKAKANINKENHKNDTPIISAAENGHLDIVKYLFNKGISVNQVRDGGDSSIYSACEYLHKDVIKFLVANGVDINTKITSCFRDITPLSKLTDAVLDINRISFEREKAQDNIKILLTSPLHSLHMLNDEEINCVINIIKSTSFFVPYKIPLIKDSNNQYVVDESIQSVVATNKSYVSTMLSSSSIKIIDLNVLTLEYLDAGDADHISNILSVLRQEASIVILEGSMENAIPASEILLAGEDHDYSSAAAGHP